MNRGQLEHAIIEIGERFGLDYFYIIGSAAILGSLPDQTDADLIGTRDVDVIPNPADPEKIARLADQVDFVLGEGSAFDHEHGYYVQGLDMNSPTYAPPGWTDRAVPVKAGYTTALCMETHDLAVSKYGAGREQDLTFTAALVRHGLVRKSLLLARASQLDAGEQRLERIRVRIERDFG